MEVYGGYLTCWLSVLYLSTSVNSMVLAFERSATTTTGGRWWVSKSKTYQIAKNWSAFTCGITICGGVDLSCIHQTRLCRWRLHWSRAMPALFEGIPKRDSYIVGVRCISSLWGLTHGMHMITGHKEESNSLLSVTDNITVSKTHLIIMKSYCSFLK